MYRTLLKFLVESGLICATGVFVFWFGLRRPNLPLLIGCFSGLILVNLIRLIPLLRIESLHEQLRRTAKEGKQPLPEFLNQAVPPARIISMETIYMIAFLLVIGLLLRAIR
jgi:hypothetical protein